MNDVPPDEPKLPAALAGALQPGLIKAVQIRAVAAIRHVVGAYAPRVLAQSQRAKDERDASSLFTARLAAAAAERAADDPELVERMFDRLARKEFQTQINLEETARLAITYVPENAEATEAPNEDEGENVDPDWLNTYAEHAGRANDDRLRDIWARVLAGEIRRPGTTSLRTLQFLSVLDKPAAEALKALLPWIYNRSWLPYESLENLTFDQRQLLRDEGLLGSLDSDIKSIITLPDQTWAATFGDRGVFVNGTPGTTISVPCTSLSRVAKELAGILPAEVDPRAPRMLFEAFKSHDGVSRLRLGKIRREGATLILPIADVEMDWHRPPAPPIPMPGGIGPGPYPPP